MPVTTLITSGYVFFGTAILGWIGMFLTVPEVRGREYEELDELFEAKTPTRKFPETKTRKQLAAEADREARGAL
jgi:hypothetical protein